MYTCVLDCPAQLTEAHSELEEVKKQIIVLGDRLVEEQEVNKRSKELAATLQRKSYVRPAHGVKTTLHERWNDVVVRLGRHSFFMNPMILMV